MKAVSPKKPGKPVKGSSLMNERPSMTIGPNVKVKGDMKFEGLLRIEGFVEGQIAAPIESDLVLTSTGTFVGDITGLHEAFIDGKVTGDICVEHLTLGGTAVIHGDIACKSMNVHARAILMGQLQVSPKSVIKSKYKAPAPVTRNEPDANNEEEQPTDVDADSLNNDTAETDPLENNDETEQILDSQVEEDPVTELPPAEEVKRSYKNILLIHEPQVDFYNGGSLNSSANVTVGERIAEFIENNLELIDEIYVTLDMHHKMHMCQRSFWVDSDGQMPEIDNVITVEDVKNNVWLPRKKEQKDYCVHILEAQAKYLNEKRSDSTTRNTGRVTITPEHCCIGSQGAAILPVVNQALTEWVNYSMRNVNYISRDIDIEAQLNKHSGATTNPHDASTASGSVPVFSIANDSAALKKYMAAYDLSFLKQYANTDRLLICGQAASHCTHFSICDVIVSVIATSVVANNSTAFPEDTNESRRGALLPNNVFVLKDVLSTSNDQLGIEVKEASGRSKVEDFWQSLNENGVKISTTIEVFLDK